MDQDQRLTPLPRSVELQAGHGDYPAAYSSFYDDETLANKRSIRQYFNVVYKRLPIILAITIIVTAAVSFWSFRQPSKYSASTEMIIEARKPQVTQKDAININFGDDANYYNTQLRLLQNSDLMKKVVIALGLHREANLFGEESRGLLSSIKSMFSGGEKKADAGDSLPIVSETATNDAATGKIQLTPEEEGRASTYAAILSSEMKVDRVEGTNLVNVTISSTNPVLAAKVADKVAELFIIDDANRELEGSVNAQKQLTDSIEDLNNTIRTQESQYIEEMKSSNLPLLEKGGDLRAGNLQALQSQYNDAQAETAKALALYTAAISASSKGDILAVVGDNKAIQDARSQNLKRQADLEKRIEEIEKKINEAKENKKKLLARYTEEKQEVIDVTAQIAELESQKTRINSEVSAKIKSESVTLEKNAEREVLASLKANLDAARQREERTRVAFFQSADKANVEGQAETRLTTLKRGIETNRSLLDTYTQRQKELELAITGERPNNIKVSNKAVVPGTPYGPMRGRNILVALLVSFAAGVGLAFLMDYLDDSVRTSDDISRHVGLPTLALIPHYNVNDKRRIALTKTVGGVDGTAALITLEERNSPMAEAYRHLRTSLLFSSAGKPPQTILVTSSQPSEGKTTTAINMAITLAQADADVIIIDCDLRRPRIHSHFDVDNNKGLTNYLSGEKSTENMIKSSPNLPRLKIITSGPIPPNPAELLSSHEMKNLLQFLRGRFKHIIIDSPPAISFTDAAILSTLVDGVVLVAMAGKSSIHLMRQFKSRLSNIGARIYGVVLNGIKSGSLDYDYYGTGYYDYYKHVDDPSTPVMEETAAVHDTQA